MRKNDCRHCICLIGEHKDGTGAWMCDELSKKIKDVKVCPEGMKNTENLKPKRRVKKC